MSDAAKPQRKPAQRRRADEYLSGRLDPAIAWYHAQAKRARRIYFALRALRVLTSAAVALVAGLATRHESLTLLSAVLAQAGLVAVGIADISQPRLRWAQYLATAEVLRSARWRYAVAARPDLQALIDATEGALTAAANATSGRIAHAADPK